MEMREPQKRMAVRRPSSLFVYHLESRSRAPGKKHASTKPRKNRVRRAPVKLCTKPVRRLMAPQTTTHAGMNLDGRPEYWTIIFCEVRGQQSRDQREGA